MQETERSNASQTSSPASPDGKQAWKARSDRGPHTASFPSGARLTFVIPDQGALLRAGRLPDRLRRTALLCAAHPEGPEGYMGDLVAASVMQAEQGELVTQAIEDGMQLQNELVAAMVVAIDGVPVTLTADEVAAGEFPELDIRMLLEFAERRRDRDAAGNRLPVIVLRDWASFRHEPESDPGVANGGAGGTADGADVPDADRGAV